MVVAQTARTSVSKPHRKTHITQKTTRNTSDCDHKDDRHDDTDSLAMRELKTSASVAARMRNRKKYVVQISMYASLYYFYRIQGGRY